MDSSPTSERGLADDASVRELLRPIAAILDEPDITELAVNRPGRVMVESSAGWSAREVPKLDHHHLMSLAVAIAQYTHQDISARRPILSAMLPGGERIQIVVPPAVSQGMVSITIRRPGGAIKSLDQYHAEGVFADTRWSLRAAAKECLAELDPADAALAQHLIDDDVMGFLEAAVQARKNIASVGDTGSGKTTLMKALCQHVPKDDRVVTIEDVRELFMPQHENVVHLLYSKGGQGVAQVTPADLIASAMRMKPDRVFLAELRGSEAYDFMKLLTTGHAGSLTSFHAQSCAVAIERFALMAKEHPEAAAYEDRALKRLLNLTIDIVAHIAVEKVLDERGHQIGKRRRLVEIHFDPLARIGGADPAGASA
jgi:type IV secretion system protein VirB11